ncbi:uncharacterized protein G2W53_023594 [Senna tora]|uniref:Uncharacterized protein n=1 Tax=Senna tora TaxID=362788 RepID=A0A834TAR9_9FABA|nr:uncharacterized protein G2W53_023594 [Senna tora]
MAEAEDGLSEAATFIFNPSRK